MSNQASADAPSTVTSSIPATAAAPAALATVAPAPAAQPARDINAEIAEAASRNDTAKIAQLANEAAKFIDMDSLAKIASGSSPDSGNRGQGQGAANAQTQQPDATAEDASAEVGEGTDEATAAADEAEHGTDANEEGNQDGTNGGEGNASPGEKRFKQWRLRPKNAVEERAAEIMKTAGLGMKESLAIAEREAGIQPDAATPPANPIASATPKADEPAAQVDPSLPQTVEQAEANLAELKAKRRQALKDFDNDTVVETEDAIEALASHKEALRTRETAKAQEAQRNYDTAFAASNAKAVELYEFTTRPDSPEMQRLKEVDEAWHLSGDPAYYDANKPLLLSQIVAREFRIAPRSKRPVAAKPAAASPSSNSPKTVPVLASGSSRTNTPPTREAQTQALIDSVPKNPGQLEDFLRNLGAGAVSR